MTKLCRKPSHSWTKGKSLIFIQIQEAIWRKSNNLKPLLSPNEELHVSQEVKRNAPVSEGKSYRPVITAEDQYAYYDLLLRVSGTNHICSVKTLQSIIPGEGGTALYGLYALYGYVPLRRLWFSSSLL